jgi:tRNA threonylcarbamoyladenosine biosynthesis protein TsaE
VVALEGALGAGKTHFVKGLAAGLGLAPDAIASPTFVIAAEHARSGGGALVHFDLYRLGRAEELEAAGFADALAPENVVAIEWADRFPGALPDDRLTVRLERDAVANARRVVVQARGERSRACLARLRAALAQEEASRWH